MKGKDHSEDVDVDGRIILEYMLEKWGRDQDQDRDQWQAVANMVMNLWVP
jgi:hypothetical protein